MKPTTTILLAALIGASTAHAYHVTAPPEIRANFRTINAIVDEAVLFGSGYTEPFRELNWERLQPPGIRYQPRTDHLIGMFATDRPNKWAGETSHVLSGAEKKKARESRARQRTTKPHSIGTRVLAAMRAKRAPMSTSEMIELANTNRPAGCVEATKHNIYEALKPLRAKGLIESTPADDPRFVNWSLMK